MDFSKVYVYFQTYSYTKYMRRLTAPWFKTIGNFGGLFGLCLGGSFISILEPIVHLLMTCFRRHHVRKIQAEVTTGWKSLKKRSMFPRMTKRLPLRERVKKWDKLPASNDISMLQSDFKMYLNYKRTELVLPE